MNEVQEKPKCKFCGSEKTNKGGFVRKDRKQRYYCRNCQRFFRKNAVPGKAKKSYDPKIYLLPHERRLIAELNQIAKELGKMPTTKDIALLLKEKKCHSLQNYYAVFGSYVDAIKVAGLKQHYRQEFVRQNFFQK